MMYKITDSQIFGYHAQPEAVNIYAVQRRLQSFAALMENSAFQIEAVYVCDIYGNTALYDKASVFGVETENFENTEAGQYIADHYEELLIRRGTTSWMQFSDDPDTIYLIKTVLNQESLLLEGILCIMIEDSYFEALAQNHMMRMAVYNESGELIFCDNTIRQLAGEVVQTESGSFFQTSDDRYLIVRGMVSKKKWTLAGYVSEQEMLGSHRRLMNHVILIEIFFLIASALFAAQISKGMTANILALIDGFQKIGEGEAVERIPCKSGDETAYLCKKFNEMNAQLKTSIEQAVVSRTQREKAEYKALLAQMNPHFLYNALEGISAMARMRRQTEISDAIGKLAGLLRVSLSGKEQEIPLSMELTYVRQYLELMKMVYGTRIEWDIISEEELESVRIPKLLLQPLIENSMVHGFKGAPDLFTIVVVVREDNGKLMIELFDNGKGMKQELADQILNGEAAETLSDDRSHIGIRSIQTRIRMLYGQAYGIRLECSEGNGMIVRLCLPIKEETNV